MPAVKRGVSLTVVPICKKNESVKIIFWHKNQAVYSVVEHVFVFKHAVELFCLTKREQFHSFIDYHEAFNGVEMLLFIWLLSPLLFALFINELEEYLVESACEPVRWGAQ